MRRYNITWGCGGACLTSIEEDSGGDYVAFEDIESLTAERDRLRKALNHPLLNQVLMDLEDADADDTTCIAAMEWKAYRDEALN